MLIKSLKDSPVKSAVAYNLLWAAVTNALFFLTDKVYMNITLFALSFMIVYPIMTFWLCFRHSKTFGLKWYVPIVIIAISTAEYFLVSDFKAITPNIIVMTVICVFFASGLGNCFADKEYIEAQNQERKIKKLHEDKKYKNITDD